jgi:endoglucanase
MKNTINISKMRIFEAMRSIAIIVLVVIIGFSMITCDTGGGGGSRSNSGKSGNSGNNGKDTRPTSPESMSTKTALEYFTDNNIKAGWNLGNTLDAVNAPAKAAETAWGNPAATQALFNGVKQSGFDIVRIPVTWIGHIGSAPDYKVDETRLRRVAEVVGYAKTAGIKAVIINIHHDGNYTDPAKGTWGFVDFAGAVNNASKKNEIQNQIGKVWTQIAEYFKNYGDYLIFETLNEVHSGNWGNGNNSDPVYQNQQNILFDWNQAALSAIRATGGNNATRYVAVPGLGSTEPETVIAAHTRGKLLPNDGSNGTNKFIVSVHYYAPWRYTVASAVASQAEEGLLHTWGTDDEKNHLTNATASLKTTFINNDIAVYFGEWGAPTGVRSSMSATIKDMHLDYIGSVAATARANSIVPILWDDGGDFKMLERSNGKPKTGLWADVLSKIMTAVN